MKRFYHESKFPVFTLAPNITEAKGAKIVISPKDYLLVREASLMALLSNITAYWANDFAPSRDV
jgi:hypothetical protein